MSTKGLQIAREKLFSLHEQGLLLRQTGLYATLDNRCKLLLSAILNGKGEECNTDELTRAKR